MSTRRWANWGVSDQGQRHLLFLVRLPLFVVRSDRQIPRCRPISSSADPIAWVVRHTSSTFWWRIEGDCLWDVCIRDGDLISVDRAGKRRLGREVLGVVDGAIIANILKKRNGRFFCAPVNGHTTSTSPSRNALRRAIPARVGQKACNPRDSGF